MKNPLDREELDRILIRREDNPMILKKRESATLEFKESFHKGSIGSYLKTMAAFANHSGGYIVFGIGANPHTIKGLEGKPLKQFNQLKPEDVTSLLSKHFEPEIEWDHCSHFINDKTIGIIYVYPCMDKPCICKSALDNSESKYRLTEGAIYYRYNGQNRAIRYGEISKIIEERRKAEESQWINFLTKVAKVGIANAGVFDLKRGAISGDGGTILIEPDILEKIAFIKEGEFSERKGKPTLKLIGNVKLIETGKIVTTGKKEEVLKAIDEQAVLYSFLDQEAVKNPMEYIKTMCSSNIKYSPLYYFVYLSGLSIDEVINEIESNVVTRAQGKKFIIDRLKGEYLATKKIVGATKQGVPKDRFVSDWLGERVFVDDNINFYIEAIQTIEADKIVEHKEYILPMMKQLITTSFESVESKYSTTIRKSVAYVDQSLYFEKCRRT